MLDAGQRRRLARKPSREAGQRVLRALDLDRDALRIVEHPAGELEFAAPAARRRAGNPTPCTAPRDANRAAFDDAIAAGAASSCGSGRPQCRDLRFELGDAALQRGHLVQSPLARGVRAAREPGQPGVHALAAWWPRPAMTSIAGLTRRALAEAALDVEVQVRQQVDLVQQHQRWRRGTCRGT